ncbi:MAG: glycosyltransferase [Paludibacteraceae bacterium]|nr:glycosyltransferase [Paludibacteraceae bacterium]MBN2786974.1 glycosyltransferase [Paludibacteraceae bacterium]
MQKVLIISSPFFDYQISVGRAFKSLGYDVKIETYDEPIHPFKGLLKWRHKFAKNKELLRNKSKAKYNIYIQNVFNQYQPDIVFTYNGTILYTETLVYFRKSSKVLLWMYDSVLRPDRIQCVNHIDAVDAFFCFENKDVEYFKTINKTAYFLPLACDTSVYFPIENKKDIDILFVGTIYTSKNRIRVLEEVAKRYPKRKVLFYGHYKPFYKNPFTWLFRSYRSVFKNVNISPQKVNELFSRTKIALNTHHEQSTDGANQRVFEIGGARAYQICDYNPFIQSLYPNGEAGLYKNDQEMFTLIDEALENDKSEMANKAYMIITSKHLFKNRVEEMLNHL